MARYYIKKERPHYFSIFKNSCQICHCKTLKNAKARVKRIKQSGGRIVK